MKHVIIGNGIAGVGAAEAIRELDATAAITMISDETFPPYSRPMIRYVLEGSQSHTKLPIRSADFYDELGIEPLLGHRDIGINVESCRVILANGVKVPYDRLLIAAGADPRPIKADGLGLENIFFMRTQAHAAAHVALGLDSYKY